MSSSRYVPFTRDLSQTAVSDTEPFRIFRNGQGTINGQGVETPGNEDRLVRRRVPTNIRNVSDQNDEQDAEEDAQETAEEVPVGDHDYSSNKSADRRQCPLPPPKVPACHKCRCFVLLTSKIEPNEPPELSS